MLTFLADTIQPRVKIFTGFSSLRRGQALVGKLYENSGYARAYTVCPARKAQSCKAVPGLRNTAVHLGKIRPY